MAAAIQLSGSLSVISSLMDLTLDLFSGVVIAITDAVTSIATGSRMGYSGALGS